MSSDSGERRLLPVYLLSALAFVGIAVSKAALGLRSIAVQKRLQTKPVGISHYQSRI